MREPDDALRFEIAAARGLLDAAWIAALATLVAAGLGLAFAFALAVTLHGQASAWTAGALACVSGLVGMAALWMTIRIAIDRRLFDALDDALADASMQPDPLAALDRALLDLGWIDASKAGRALEPRVRGVKALLQKTLALSFAQTLVLVAAALWRLH